jgi:hypothetical protein
VIPFELSMRGPVEGLWRCVCMDCGLEGPPGLSPRGAWTSAVDAGWFAACFWNRDHDEYVRFCPRCAARRLAVGAGANGGAP